MSKQVGQKEVVTGENPVHEAAEAARAEAREAHPYDDVAPEAPASDETLGEVVSQESSKVEQPTGEKPFYKGLGKTLNTPEELADYAMELEKRQVQLDAQLSAMNKIVPDKVPVQQAVVDDDDEKTFQAQVAEEFILNPSKAVQMLTERISGAIEGKMAKERGRKAFFESFYAKNDDLRGAEDIVDMIMTRKMPEWVNVPVGKASELLAQETRSRLASLRGSANTEGETQILSSKPAHALGSSGPTPPKAPAAKVETLGSLVSDLKSFQAKRKKRA